MVKFFGKVGRQLTLYVRQLAWLHATPKPDERSKRAKTAVSTISRLERLKKDGIQPQMPPNPAPDVVKRLIEIGLTEVAGMGSAPISWREINEWQRATGVDLAPWEARLIRALSASYIAEGRRAESENCPPPWRAEITQRERDVEEAALRKVLG